MLTTAIQDGQLQVWYNNQRLSSDVNLHSDREFVIDDHISTYLLAILGDVITPSRIVNHQLVYRLQY